MTKKNAIICVDDERTILESLDIELTRVLGNNYALEMAESGDEALELLGELLADGYEVPLAISDYIMPKMKGDEFLRRVHEISPKTLKIMLTGQADLEAIGNAIKYAKLYRYMAKPWESEDLGLTVKEALNSYYQEKEIAEQNAKLQQILEAMPVGVFVADKEGKPYYVNSRGQQLLTKGVVTNENAEDLRHLYRVYLADSDEIYPSDRDPLLNALKGKSVNIDDMEIRLSNKKIPLEVWGMPIYDAHKNLVYAIAAFQDITERKKAEKFLADYNRNLEKQVAERTEELSQTLEHLRTTQEELIQSEKMAALGQLIAGVAHEINNPLGAIRSSIENIADFLDKTLQELPHFFQTLSSEGQAYFFDLLQKSSQQKVRLSSKEQRKIRRKFRQQLEAEGIEDADTIADTLVDIGVENLEPFWTILKAADSSNILENAYQFFTLHQSTNTISNAVDRAAKIVFALKNYSRYDSHGKKVKANLIDGIETILTLYQNPIKRGVEVIRNYEDIPPFFCYPDELNQVWTNLIHNALQAMDNKGTLTIDLREKNKKVEVSITDSGKGIPTELMSKIFQPFFTTKPPGEGSGLGLDIVRKIIEKHQGNIEVESQPGKTTFTVSLPVS
jgi:PAS domain S-box-containing protein